MDDRILTFAANVQKLTVRKELDKNFKKYNETTTIELQLFRKSPQLQLSSILIHFKKRTVTWNEFDGQHFMTWWSRSLWCKKVIRSIWRRAILSSVDRTSGTAFRLINFSALLTCLLMKDKKKKDKYNIVVYWFRPQNKWLKSIQKVKFT